MCFISDHFCTPPESENEDDRQPDHSPVQGKLYLTKLCWLWFVNLAAETIVTPQSNKGRVTAGQSVDS